MKKQVLARENTKKIIEYFKGMPGEFYMLKGLMVAEHIDSARPLLSRAYDGILIAERMDEINNG